MEENRRKRNLYGLFLSYFLVFLIPTAVITSVVFKISDTIIKEEIQSNHLLNVQTAQYNLGRTLDSFSVAATSAAYSNFGHTIDLREEIDESMQLIGFLNRTSLSYIFVQDIFMIYENGPYVYSGQTSFTEDNFYRYLIFDGKSDEEIQKYMNELKEPAFLRVSIGGSINASEKDREYILYAIPCMRKEYRVGVMAFLLDVEKLNLFLGNGGEDGWLFLTDRNGNALNENPAWADRLEKVMERKEEPMGDDLALYHEGNTVCIYGNVRYAVLDLVSVTSAGKALERLSQFRDLTLAGLLGVFLLGMCCVLLAWRQNKKSLARVTSYYEEELKKVLPMRRKEVLYALAEGRYLYEEDLVIQCEESMMELNAPWHCCVLVLGGAPAEADLTVKDMEGLLSEPAGEKADCSYVWPLYRTQGAAVYLTGMPQKPDGPGEADHREGGVIFISRAVESLLEVHLCYAEALSRMYEVRSRKTDLDGVECSREQQARYDSLIGRVNICLSRDDMQELKGLEEELAETLDREEAPISLRRKLLLLLFITFPDTWKTPFDIADILKMNTVEEVKKSTYVLFRTYMEEMKRKEGEAGSALDIGRITEFIEENYTDPMFSLQLLADRFHVSNSYLSWFFRQKTGSTVLDYTTQLKMKRATQLLDEGNTLKEVALKVGYINVSSFIRRFKQTMGLTPGEYKKGVKNP